MDGSVTSNSTSHGAPDGFRFELVWKQAEPKGTAAEASSGRLTLTLASTVLWGLSEPGKPTGFSWTWVDLLEHLAQNWAYLRWEESNPIGIHAQPEKLRALAEERWAELTIDQRDEEEQQVYAFLEAHDLASGLHGAYPAPLYWIKQGKQVRISCRDRVHWQETDAAFQTLSQLGTGIADRLRGLSDERARNAVTAWDARGGESSERLLEIASSIPRVVLEEIAGGKGLLEYFDVNPEQPESELLAVARMGYREIAPNALRPVLERLRAAAHVWTGPLDMLAEEARAQLDHWDDLPHEQGYQTARWLRQKLQKSEEQAINPEALLRQWKITVEDIELPTSGLDAVCCWGPKRGPAVLVNRKGLHGRFAGRRATLAHEICHLLLDRQGALPLGEVLGGHAPPGVEARARAFAAELLLPRAVVARKLAGASNEQTARVMVEDLCSTYEVSREITAWQARNSGAHFSGDVKAYLRSLVRDRARF